MQHSNNNNQHKSMMWMMAICCGLPLLIVIVFGSTSGVGSLARFVIPAVIVLCLSTHFFMMWRTHGKSEDGQNKDDKKGHRSGMGCH